MASYAAAVAFNAQSRAGAWQQFCDPTLAFRRAEHGQLLKIWQEQAGAGLPPRSALTARLLKPFLSHIGLVERVAVEPSRYRWRLVGTAVTQVLGERTGTHFEDNAPEHQTARWNAAADLVLDLRRPLRFVARVAVANMEFLANESLLMPLADEDGRPRYVMGFNRYEYDQSWEQAAAEAQEAATYA